MSPLLATQGQAPAASAGMHPLVDRGDRDLRDGVRHLLRVQRSGCRSSTTSRCYAVVNNSVNVRQDSPVRIAGIDVGTVSGASRRTGQTSKIAFTMRRNGLPVHTDATIRIRDRLFLEGGYYLELDPGSPSAPVARRRLHDPAVEHVDRGPVLQGALDVRRRRAPEPRQPAQHAQRRASARNPGSRSPTAAPAG